jgi:hypothetical protein
MGWVGTMGFTAIMASGTIMASEAPVCSSGSDHTGDRIGDPPGCPMPIRRRSSHLLRPSMSPHRHRARPRPHRGIGTIVMIRRATTRLSSSALMAGDPSLRLHHEQRPAYLWSTGVRAPRLWVRLPIARTQYPIPSRPSLLGPAMGVDRYGASALETATLGEVPCRAWASCTCLGHVPYVTMSSDSRGSPTARVCVRHAHRSLCRRPARWCP